ncbi:sugar ABC transporter substrate-binding protein [Devosia sp. MC1541]|uniref:ABC transporter substrate-binding protein n=1 Tax=Devosia sp. MC1541 TaxID=2725264 RepID=UPI00145F64F3|nr:sugar ABC transporter substrate-binding protein [Devosia sp. MC1541]
MITLKNAARAAALAAALSSVSMVAVLAADVKLTLISAERDEVLAPVIEAFEAANPGITVEHQSIPFESMNAAIEARIGGGDDSIDVLLVDSPRVAAMVSRGYLKSLEDLRSEIEPLVTPVALDALSVDGTIYTLPLWTSTQVMYYNKDLLDKAGIPHPGSDQEDRLTYDEVLEQAKKAQEAGAKYGFAFEQIDRYYQLQPIFEGLGAGSGLTGEGNLNPDITNEKWIEGASFYAKLFEDGISPRGIPTGQVPPLFAAGEMAFIVGGPWQLAGYTNTEGLNFGVAPVPYHAGGKPVTPTGSWALAVSPHSSKPEEAMKLAKFMSLDPQGAFKTVEANPIPPVNLEAFAIYADWFAPKFPENGADVQKIMGYELRDTAVSRPLSAGFVAFEEVMNRVFGDLRNGADVKATLEDAQRELNSTLSRIQ